MPCFRCNAIENFIFSLKYCQLKVDLNIKKKSLVFVTIRHLHTKISYLRKNTHLRKDAALLHFRLKKSSENMIFPWNAFFTNFRKMKILFFMQWELIIDFHNEHFHYQNYFFFILILFWSWLKFFTKICNII